MSKISNKTVHITCPDFKYRDGRWAGVSYQVYEGVVHLITTRARVYYDSMLTRCRKGGDYQKRFPTYLACSHNFKDFQEFAEWCQSQKGYANLDDLGKLWTLDKDILVPGNKIYSKDTCVFVPEYINNMIIKRKKDSKFPRGVSHGGGRSKKFKARCNMGGKGRVVVGWAYSPEEAHKIWQLHKVIHMREQILRYSNHPDSREDVIHSLLQRVHKIEEDMNNGRITEDI